MLTNYQLAKSIALSMILLLLSLSGFSQEPLSGTYTIGGDEPDYETFNDAVENLANNGVSGLTQFLIASGTYIEQVTIPIVEGSSEENQIIFESLTGDSTDVVLQFGSTNADSAWVLRFDTCKYVQLRHITIESTSSIYDHSMVEINNAESIQLFGCRFVGSQSGTGYNYTQYLILSNEVDISSNDLIIKNCFFEKGRHGVVLTGKSNSEKTQNLEVKGNVFNDQNQGGLTVLYYSNSLIKENTINIYSSFGYNNGINLRFSNNVYVTQNNISGPTGTGINIWDCEQSRISKNSISFSINYGINLYSAKGTAGSEFMVANNLVISDGIGINMYLGNNYVNIYHNSIYSDKIGLNVDESNNVNIVNNILYSHGDILYGRAAINVWSSCNNVYSDYNNFFTDVEKLAIWHGTTYNTLAELQAASGQDANSLSVNPEFVSETDLHTFSLKLNGKAFLGLVTHDIDGEERHPTHPDIGADEFDPRPSNMALIEIVGPTSACGLTANETIRVRVENRGSEDLEDGVPIHYTLDGGETVITEFVPGFIDSGSSIVYNFIEKANLSIPNKYNLKVYLSENEENAFTGDDTLSVAIYSYGNINTFGFLEDFETGFTQYSELSSNSDAHIEVNELAGNASNYGLSFETYSGGHYWDWVGGNTPTHEQIWEDNYHFHAFAKSCNIHLGELENPALQFDIRFVKPFSYSSIRKWLRLLINDTDELHDINGQSLFHSPENTPFETKTFELAHLLGSSFNLTFQSCIHGEKIYVDNIRIGELPQINLGNDYEACSNYLNELDAGGGEGYSYMWRKAPSVEVLSTERYFAPSESGTYWVEVHSHHGLVAFDSIVVTINPAYTFEESYFVCSGSSFEFRDGTLLEDITENTMHISSFLSIHSCDSIYNTYLVVKPLYDLAETDWVCYGGSFTFPDGTTQDDITEQVVHISNLLSIFDCDSVITTTVNVNPIYYSEETLNVCHGESHTFPDGLVAENITEQIIHLSELLSIHECDSLISTTVSVNPIYSINETVNICMGDSHTFPDGTQVDNITEQVFHSSELLSQHSCDSTINTTVIPKPHYEVPQTVWVCHGDSHEFPDGTVVEDIVEGFEQISYLESIFGCDSTIVSTVNVNPVYSLSQTVYVCPGDDFEFPDGTLESDITSPLEQTSFLESIFGCDSVIVTTVDLYEIYSISHWDTICYGDGYTFPDGHFIPSITETTVYSSYLETIFGCDSVIVTMIDLYETYSISQWDTICYGGSYTFPDGFFIPSITETTVHNSYLQTVFGCDSIIVTTINLYETYNIFLNDGVCPGDSYTFPDGTVFHDITSTVEHTSYLESVFGCDSIINIQVQPYPIFNIDEWIEVCKYDSYTFPDGNTVEGILEDFTYHSYLQTIHGCDSTINTNIIVYAVNTEIYNYGNYLYTPSIGELQWVDCNNEYAPIPGETNNYFYPQASGSYAAFITENGCQDTTECVTFVLDNIGINFDEPVFTVYPNPNSGLFTIDLSQSMEITISSILGKDILSEHFYKGKHILNLSHLPKGVYMLKGNCGSYARAMKIIIR